MTKKRGKRYTSSEAIARQPKRKMFDLQITIENDFKNRSSDDSDDVRMRKREENRKVMTSHKKSQRDKMTLSDNDEVLTSRHHDVDRLSIEADEEFDVRSVASVDRSDIPEARREAITESNVDVESVASLTGIDLEPTIVDSVTFSRDVDEISLLPTSENEDDVICAGVGSDEEPAPPGVEEVEEVRSKPIAPLLPEAVKVKLVEKHLRMLKYLFRESHIYMIKSNNHDNIELAKTRNIWSTPPNNETKLNKSLREARNVILVFSVRESGSFQGFARLVSESRRDSSPIPWVLPPGMSAKALGGVFKIDWLCRHQLSFNETIEIHNSFNFNKPIKIGRDGQEIEPESGKKLCLRFPPDTSVNLEKIIQDARRRHKSNGGPPKYIYPQPQLDCRDRRFQVARSEIRARPLIHDNLHNNDHIDRHHQHLTNPYKRDVLPTMMSQITACNTHQLYPPPGGDFKSLYYNQVSSAESSQLASTVAIPTTSSPLSYRLSSRVTKATNRFDDAMTSTRRYDSQSHAAACDDFIRRISSGKKVAPLHHQHHHHSSSRDLRHRSRSRDRMFARRTSFDRETSFDSFEHEEDRRRGDYERIASSRHRSFYHQRKSPVAGEYYDHNRKREYRDHYVTRGR